MCSGSSVVVSPLFLKWLKCKIHEATNIVRSEFAQQTNLHNSDVTLAKSPKV